MTSAVSFNQAAFRQWMRTLDEFGQARLLRGTADSEYSDALDNAANLVETAIHELREAPEVWSYRPGVTDVDIWLTADSETADGGGLVVVTVDGVELSAAHLQAGDLIYADTDDGIVRMDRGEAAAMALTAVANAANTAVAAYEATTGHGGQVVERSLMIHGITTEEQFRALETHLGHSHGWMGRFKGGHSGILLDQVDNDLNLAISWALTNGLTVEQTRTTRLIP
ncbi:hypothetical protein OOJ91_34245 [Micromonospora lupini]|uniref:hypothetical protein n=1 Tax=Micromonospora lupini TaxID=285679 RepID=UPI00225A4790|nr:hypothetical protein [Micromonospora lupini]MCX5070911.1 hypothetical protein [Micromonospora lupini]